MTLSTNQSLKIQDHGSSQETCSDIKAILSENPPWRNVDIAASAMELVCEDWGPIQLVASKMDPCLVLFAITGDRDLAKRVLGSAGRAPDLLTLVDLLVPGSLLANEVASREQKSASDLQRRLQEEQLRRQSLERKIIHLKELSRRSPIALLVALEAMEVAR